MLAEQELSQFTPQKDMLLTVGVFDGVHLGHQHLIARLKEEARRRGLLSGVVTFRQHPRDVLGLSDGLPYLTSPDDKLDLLTGQGVDAVVMLTFDDDLAGLDARSFVALLKKHLRMKGLVVGADFALGRGREGSPQELRKMGEQGGFTVTVVPPLAVDGEVVSSTAIRKALADGDMDRVVRLTGRPFTVSGKIVPGTGLGRQLGLPTVNQDFNTHRALPADGVYATVTHVNGRTYRSVTNIGHRPTFRGRKRTVETHLLDYSGDLYGRDLTVDIVERLRAEKKFQNPDELKKQIARDIEKGRTVLSVRAKSKG